MITVVKQGMSDVEAKRVQIAYHEMIKSEGWKYFSDFITTRINEKIADLLNVASKESDIRVINELGRDIALLKYILSEPQAQIDNIERHFKRKENKE